jgi:hypothetical protein
MTEARWLASRDEEGETCFRVGWLGPDLIAEWVGVARLVASPDGSRHELTFEDGVSAPERKKIRSGGARVLVRSLTGGLGLHGAAVAIDGRGLVFLGASGFGKSTLAAAHASAGASLLADDAVALTIDARMRRIAIEPTEADHWLDAASRAALGLPDLEPREEGGKAPLAALAPAPVETPLHAIVALDWGDNPPRLEPVHGVAALARILPHVARFALDSPVHQRAELERLEAVLRQVPVFIFVRPRSLSGIQGAMDITAALCKEGA